MGTITSANAVYMLSVGGVFGAPQQLQGFAADDIFDTEEIDAAETMMGVDGVLSAGFVYVETPQMISLQADSPSTAIFEAWYQAEVTLQDKLPANASVSLPSIGRRYTMINGFLKRIPQIPGAKKVLQPRKFTIVWQRVLPSPA